MHYDANDVKTYIDALPDDRKTVIEKLRNIIKASLPAGFEESFAYGMIAYVVPLSIYPAGYHAKKGEPLPFLALASQKHYVALYHMGLYADLSLFSWFTDEYAKRAIGKLDMGKSCIRFKKLEQIPYELIGELCRKISVDDYIQTYERSRG